MNWITILQLLCITIAAVVADLEPVRKVWIQCKYRNVSVWCILDLFCLHHTMLWKVSWISNNANKLQSSSSSCNCGWISQIFVERQNVTESHSHCHSASLKLRTLLEPSLVIASHMLMGITVCWCFSSSLHNLVSNSSYWSQHWVAALQLTLYMQWGLAS